MLTISAFYAGLTALVFLWLSFLVVRQRSVARVSVGDGGDKLLRKRMRAQANCVEYAPIGLILLALVELQGAPEWVVHMLGASLFLGRLIHGWGFGHTPQIIWARRVGVSLNVAMILIAALANIGHAVL